MKSILRLMMVFALGFLLSTGPAEAAKKKRPVAPSRPVVTTPDLQISQAVVERNGTLQIINTMTCDTSPVSVCQNLCGATACDWQQQPCRDCLGTGSETLREIFQSLTATYRMTAPIDNETLIEVLIARTIVLTPQSPYDYYNSSQDPGLAAQLQAMCGSQTGLVGVMYDGDSRPTRALLVVCNTQQGVRASFLERINDSPPDSTLKLKLTTELELRKP